MNENEEIEYLKAEVERLKQVVIDLTAALKIVTESNESAKAFIERVESLLNN